VLTFEWINDGPTIGMDYAAYLRISAIEETTDTIKTGDWRLSNAGLDAYGITSNDVPQGIPSSSSITGTITTTVNLLDGSTDVITLTTAGQVTVTHTLPIKTKPAVAPYRVELLLDTGASDPMELVWENEPLDPPCCTDGVVHTYPLSITHPTTDTTITSEVTTTNPYSTTSPVTP
jgi:hypothetical protein